MRLPGLKRLRQAGRWARSRFVRHGLILGYHRVSEAARDPYSMCVSPQHFAEQLEVLRRQACLMSLPELVEGLETGNLPERAVGITFDDGYADMLYQARPLLEQHQAPATFFITTGYLGREFWWDELDRLLSAACNPAGRLPGAIGAEAGGGNGAGTPGQRRPAWPLYNKLLWLSAGEREQVMGQIRLSAGPAATPAADQRAMTPEELAELAASELVTIGAHSVTHPMLAVLAEADQAEEIRQSRRYLEEVLERPVTAFSYPNGSRSGATMALVRENGFQCACSSDNDVAWRGSDPFQLPRFWVGDWDGDRFARWLRSWL